VEQVDGSGGGGGGVLVAQAILHHWPTSRILHHPEPTCTT